jgi:nucleotide-binding universal stress UspA family protein
LSLIDLNQSAYASADHNHFKSIQSNDMTFKKILVHIDHSKATTNRVNAAIELALRFQATLAGIFVVPEYAMPSYVEAQISPAIIADINRHAFTRAREALTQFIDLANESGLEMFSVVVEGNPVAKLCEYAALSDLLIVGQYNNEDSADSSEGMIDQVIIESGASCLVWPNRGATRPPGNNILVTWNSSKESARAIRQSLPLLKRAGQVRVLTSDSIDSTKTGRPNLKANIVQYLREHGIQTTVRSSAARQLNIGELILAEATDMDADLIVMGGYGHSRLREIILGGATHTLLAETTIPVFMVH